MKNLFLMLFITILFSSCATIFTGTKTAIQFDSEPDGATVEMDGLEIGVTPFVYNGYRRKTASLPKSFNAVAILNLAGFWGWVIDFATGAINKFDMKGIDVTLQKEN